MSFLIVCLTIAINSLEIYLILYKRAWPLLLFSLSLETIAAAIIVATIATTITTTIATVIVIAIATAIVVTVTAIVAAWL